METKNKLRYRLWGFIGAGLGILALSGCAEGDHTAPTKEEVQEGAEYIEMRRPDGSTMDCVLYSARGKEGYSGFSWFALDCDWANAYTGPSGEVQAGTGTRQLECQPGPNNTFICKNPAGKASLAKPIAVLFIDGRRGILLLRAG